MRIYLSRPSDSPNVAPTEIELEGESSFEIDELIKRIQTIKDATNN